jgi:formate hydrogenlyase transcriptional activator
MQDYALFLLDVDGQVVAWYAGAERIYGYKSGEVIGQQLSRCYPDEDGHVGTECWNVRKDGSRFWANVITVALKDKNGDLQAIYMFDYAGDGCAGCASSGRPVA